MLRWQQTVTQISNAPLNAFSPIKKKSASRYSMTLNAASELCHRSTVLADSNDDKNVPDCVRTATTPVQPVRVPLGKEAFRDICCVEDKADEVRYDGGPDGV